MIRLRGVSDSAKVFGSSGLGGSRGACDGTICRFFVLSGVEWKVPCRSVDFATMFLTFRAGATIL